MTTLLAEPGRPMPVAAGMRLPDFREDVPAGDLAALVALLDDVELDRAGSMDLLARAVGWERVVAMAQARQARALGELTSRREVGFARVADELQAAWCCSAYHAQRTVQRAEDLVAHPAIADALAAGGIDLRRVDAVVDALPVGGDPRRWDGLVAAVLEDAPLSSPAALRKQAARLVLAAEPAEAAARHERARTCREVSLQPSYDGMALLSAYLPAPEAVAVFTVVDALAGTCRDADDDRGVGQRRADAFAAIFTDIARTGVLPDGRTLPTKHGRCAEIQVTVAATTLLGLDDLPGELAGYGPIPADLARRMAQDGTWRRLLTDPADGTLVERGRVTYRPGADLTAFVAARDVTCTFMGCGQPAWRCELDHREPFDPRRPAEGQTTPENLDARCKHHHELKTHGGWSVRRIPGSGACEWTDPWGVTFTRLAVPIVVGAAALARLRAPTAPGGTSHGASHGGAGRGSDARPHDPGSSHTSVLAGQPPGGYPDDPPF